MNLCSFNLYLRKLLFFVNNYIPGPSTNRLNQGVVRDRTVEQ